jgi:hypothetical protein
MKSDTSNSRGIKPGSLVMFMPPAVPPASTSPAVGQIFTAVRKGENLSSSLRKEDKSEDAWFLDKTLPMWVGAEKSWSGVYTGAVPAKYLVPINDPDADTGTETTDEQKENKCESI